MKALYAAQLNEDDRTFILHLYKSYYNFARKNIYTMIHNNNDIEDLIDEVFIKLIEKINVLRTLNDGKITAYIFYTIKHVTLNYIKHQHIENKHLYISKNMDSDENLFYTDSDIVEKLVRQEELLALCDTLSHLPRNQKELLYFKYNIEMSNQEIAELLGISPDSVREYLTRARRSAKKLMEKERK